MQYAWSISATNPGFDVRLKVKLATGRLPLVVRIKSIRIAVAARCLRRGLIFVVRHSSLVATTVVLCCGATLGRFYLYPHFEVYRRNPHFEVYRRSFG
jgi:hypothetical protein